jgi:cold shock CspA family protein
MGRSQESTGKKEKAKKKIQKRKEKEEKKEQRKANSDRGKSLEEMMVYVDENGNISDTPPDPRKKKIIRTEDITLGATRRDDTDEEDVIRNGVVTFFNESKGYGFIKDLKTQDSIFVHVNDLDEPIKEKDKVSFEIMSSKRGPTAVSVKKSK